MTKIEDKKEKCRTCNGTTYVYRIPYAPVVYFSATHTQYSAAMKAIDEGKTNAFSLIYSECPDCKK